MFDGYLIGLYVEELGAVEIDALDLAAVDIIDKKIVTIFDSSISDVFNHAIVDDDVGRVFVSIVEGPEVGKIFRNKDITLKGNEDIVVGTDEKGMRERTVKGGIVKDSIFIGG